MLNPIEFHRELKTELHSKLTLTHPIFKQVLETNNLQLLKMMALQGYQLTLHFIDYIEKLYFYCPLENHKRKILYNLFEEVTGYFSKTKNHVVLMQLFLKSLGISDTERDNTKPFTETKKLIDYRKSLVNDIRNYHLGAAAVMIASEGQNLETYSGKSRADLIKTRYHLTDEDLLFFSIHQKEDVAHTEEGYALVTDLCLNEKMQQSALATVRYTCDLFYNMYSGIQREYQKTLRFYA